MHTITTHQQRVCSILGALAVALGFAGAAQAQILAPLAPFKNTADFETCQRHSYPDDACLMALERLVQAKPQDAMAAGKITRLNFNAWVALRFFEVAARQKVDGFCQDKDVVLAVAGGLALPADYPDAKRANALFGGHCFNAQVAAVTKELAGESGESYLKKNACPILEQHQQAPAACQPSAASTADAPAAAPDKLPKLDKSKIALGTVKVYRGPEGERVTMAPVQGTDLYLIRFDGVAGPWDGKVVLHRLLDRGHDQADFWTEHGGTQWNSVARRDGMTVYVPGYKAENGFAVGYSDKLSQEASAADLLKAYQP